MQLSRVFRVFPRVIEGGFLAFSVLSWLQFTKVKAQIPAKSQGLGNIIPLLIKIKPPEGNKQPIVKTYEATHSKGGPESVFGAAHLQCASCHFFIWDISGYQNLLDVLWTQWLFLSQFYPLLFFQQSIL